MAVPQEMPIAAPDWLTQRGGGLRLSHDGRTWLVLLNGSPQYALTASPAAGKYSCTIVQTINSQRLDKGATYSTAQDAVRGGLEELRVHIGW